MDLLHLFSNVFTTEHFVALLTIMLINIVLSGDNAIVIAMAVRSLPEKQRKQGIYWGTAIAVLLRIILTFFAAKILDVPYMKLFGGILIAWIAIKLFLGEDETEDTGKNIKTIWKAVFTILIADLVMSVDNVLAVAGASKGNPALLIIGLGTSIPIVIFASKFLSRTMERFPFVAWIGAAVLGRVAGEMIITDPVMARYLHNSSRFFEYGFQALIMFIVVASGFAWMKWRASRTIAPVETIKIKNTSDGYNPFYVSGWDVI